MSRQKNLKRNLLICLLAGSAVMYTLPLHAATSVVANNALPTLPMVNGQIKDGYGFVTGGNNTNIVTDGLQMNITQNDSNAAIKWGSFDVVGSATVNFDYTGKSDFNTLNYVNSASASQIYGTINAQHEGYNGNIFVVNPAGVQIGPSAQINVGSLYVSNKYLNENELAKFNGNNITSLIDTTKTANAELMSLGNINAANNVTFDGNRIVLDTDRVIIADSQNGKLNIKTTDTNNVVLGYEAYDENNGYTDTVNKEKSFDVTKVTIKNGTIEEQDTNVKGYMWVEDVEQLQAINTNLGGNYALRNSIDATSTSGWSDSEHDTKNEGFLSIGIDYTGKVTETNINNEIKYGFYGNFDGIDYNIFGLTINREDTNNVGLFGVTHDANISNVTLVGGSITGQSVVGSVVGAALGSTHITNATNSASVTGTTDVGGIVGASRNEIISDGNNGTITVNANAVFKDLINTGTIKGTDFNDNATNTSISNTGGLIGYMHNGTLKGNSYNLGDVSSEGHNVGGLVGHAVNSTIGNEGEDAQLVYNRLDVEGAYNVGGIVGNMKGTTVQNAENSGNVTATGYDNNGTYTYHTAETDLNNIPNGTLTNGIVTAKVNVANVGGIAGKADDTVKSDGTVDKKSDIKNVTNSGNVSSSSDKESQKFTSGKTYEYEYYTAGNVGGIVGSAVDTNITNATNRENEVRGAHNVGGVAGYFGGSGKITTGINDGGDIMATGARNASGFVKETVRPVEGGADESFIIGNIGGIVGYLDGDDVFVTASGNRGTVHTQDIAEANKDEVLNISKAANVGGVVGKIDRDNTDTITKNTIENAAVSNSYNTGDVRGYTGVGGVVGMMYNGEVAGSYNLGYISTTRQSTTGGSIDALNMGGVVGDTTELSGAEVYLYDVYNKGQIGDKEYNYFGRHVGGVVGRLSGTVEKAYNNGAIYNGYNVVGGIAGWMAQGNIKNAFNTGNITVLNRNNATSQVGGIVGAASDNYGVTINNAYNLGTLRSFKDNNVVGAGNSTLGGIIGHIQDENKGNNYINITNVYTTGNLYVDNGTIGSIYGNNTINTRLNVENAYYIRPDENLVEKGYFTDLYDQNNTNADKDNSNKPIAFGDKDKGSSYSYYDNSGNYHSLTFTQQSGGNVDGGKYQNGQDSVQVSDDNWRIYDGNTPILNAFLPDSEKYFSNGLKDNDGEFIGTIQYGTAYDPLLTIINTNRDLTFNFGSDADELSISNAAGIAVYGGGLTFNNFATSGGTGYFGGTIYADGALNLNSNSNIGLGSAAQIYGSAVNINTDGKVTIYGDVTATGNIANGAIGNKEYDEKLPNAPTEIEVENKGDISINAGDVDVYGTLTTSKNVSVPGIEDQAVNTWTPGAVSNPNAEMVDIADRFAHKTTNSNDDGNIKITANGTADGSGNVNLYYGNKQEGLITTGGDLTVTGEGDVYVDSDLAIGGNLKLEAGAGKEALLDITNIGQVQNNHDNEKAKETLHNFLTHFATNQISFGETQDAKITVDMWNGNELDLNKFDYNGATLVSKLNSLKVDSAGDKSAQQLTHIWVNNGEQLKNIQTADDKALGYNYALKGDINASDVQGYEAIGGTTGFTGTFDGRGNRIIGLKVNNNNGNAGIFSTVGEGGVVKNVNIYSGNFTGGTSAGAVAGMNSGRIENVTGFGNTVTVTNENGNAGGIVGVNNGNKGNIITNEDGTITLEPAENEQFATGIIDVESIGSVIAEGNNAVAGGLVGTNEGALGNSYSDSAVTSTFANNQAGLGGVVGVNKGDVQYVDSLGVTNGGTTGSSNVGGVIGINNGNMYSGYNESIVSGSSNVGGIIGTNAGTYNATDKKWTSGTVENVVNATSVTSEATDSKNTGGLVGTNTGSVTNGRNNGTITGTNYVGGLVGDNANANSILTNLVNDSSAEILGEQYVGGIAGSNSGTIKADEDNDNLVNRGSITGHKYVGGVAGENKEGATIANTLNSVVLHADKNTANDPAQYFGGVVGSNSGVIDGATNTSDINITAEDGSYVGGIIGHNTDSGTLKGEILNEGSVSGKSNVGGIIGQNDNDYVLQGTADKRLVVKNKGNAVAEDGGAAGIFYKNTGDILYADISNDGVVDGGTGTDGTGGLFGINTGTISNSTLTNSGEVKGAGNVGGLIGVNSGNVTNSTLTNTGSVTGTNNVGGLIGKNTGTITGGRDEKNSYYKYQIYNNGTINVNGNGTNIGGLIGYNTVDNTDPDNIKGSLTAGYNTGVIDAGSSTNVGGIVGNNEGTLDQVFNTVMTADGQNAITGGTNVGGLVGTNSGTLSNAYNTTEVKSTNNGVVGNAVGENDTNGTIENIYASNTSGKLIGSNINTAQDAIQNAYSFVKDDTSATTVLDEKVAQKAEESYEFDNKDDGTTWKFYDGYSNPLLKVFLTTLTVDSDQVDLVYNAGEQDLNIGQLVQDGIISAPVVKDDKDNIIYDGMDAYHNTVIKDEDNKLGASELLQNTTGQKDAGTYDNWLYSGQIASGSKDGSGFNPNNLGYDIVYTKNDSGETGVEIGKATINIDLGKVEHTYGNADVINGTGYFKNEAGYGFNITNSNLTQEMKDELNDKGLGFVFEKDNALTGDTSGRVTEDVKDGGYTWSANFELSEELKKNYQFDDNGSATLNKADGQSIVNQAKLEISVDDAETMPGVVPNFTGTNIQQGLVNGDVAGNYDYALDSSVDINVDDIYTDKIGISFGNSETYYDLDNVDWSTIPGWEFLKNYDINFDPGTLTVDSEIMPDLPDNWPNNRWDYLFADNPFDRNENFRERKAEVNFVDGAMEI